MHSLRLKLIFTFLIISITGTLLTTLIVSFYNQRAFDQLLQEQEHAELTSDLEAYYENNGSWQGINRTLNNSLPLTTPNQPPVRNEPQGMPGSQPDPAPSFALIDENGRIIIPNGRYMPGDTIPLDELAAGIPLEVDGVQVGTLLVEDLPAAAKSSARSVCRANKSGFAHRGAWRNGRCCHLSHHPSPHPHPAVTRISRRQSSDGARQSATRSAGTHQR